MRRARPALLLPPPALPGKHQCLEPGTVSSQCCQKKAVVLSATFPWLPSDQPLSTGKRNMHHIPVLMVQKSDIHLLGMSPGHPSHMWGQSESSRAKPGLAQLSQFLTPADSTDKTSDLTFLNVQGYGLEVTSIWSKPCPRQGHHRS